MKGCILKKIYIKENPVIRRALALCGIGIVPTALKTALCRWLLLTHWHLWMFLGSNISPASTGASPNDGIQLTGLY